MKLFSLLFTNTKCLSCHCHLLLLFLIVFLAAHCCDGYNHTLFHQNDPNKTHVRYNAAFNQTMTDYVKSTGPIAIDASSSSTYTGRISKKKSPSKGVFICITGQLPRLELKNKIKRLLLPLHSLGFDLYIALALHNGTQHFTNTNNGDKMRLVSDLDHAMSVLRGVEGVKEVMHFLPQHPENMYVNKKYQKMLDNKRTIARVQNHARQYQTLEFCDNWPLIVNLTQVTVRVREDILFEHSNMSEIVSLVKKGKIVTPLCEEFKGINDKVAFLPSSHARTFFHYPYERYHTYNGKIRKLNPEQFYKFVYKEKGLPLQSSSSLYVAKAVTKRLSFDSESNETSLCEVVTNGHNVCDSGCARALFNETEMNRNLTYCRVVKLNNSETVKYKSNCW